MINWSEIDTVLLDMDGTLLDLSFDNYFWLEYLPRHYAKHHSIPLTRAREFLEKKSDSLRGSLEWYCLDHWSKDLEFDIETLKYKIRHRIRFRPHTVEFLAFLREINKQIMLVTDAHPKSLSLKAESIGLHKHLDRMVSSHEFELAKENEGFWQKLQEREQIDLSRSLFIDDSPSVLHCARNAGVKITLQVLQPDSNLAPVNKSDFPGIIHFSEIMTA